MRQYSDLGNSRRGRTAPAHVTAISLTGLLFLVALLPALKHRHVESEPLHTWHGPQASRRTEIQGRPFVPPPEHSAIHPNTITTANEQAAFPIGVDSPLDTPVEWQHNTSRTSIEEPTPAPTAGDNPPLSASEISGRESAPGRLTAADAVASGTIGEEEIDTAGGSEGIEGQEEPEAAAPVEEAEMSPAVEGGHAGDVQVLSEKQKRKMRRKGEKECQCVEGSATGGCEGVGGTATAQNLCQALAGRRVSGAPEATKVVARELVRLARVPSAPSPAHPDGLPSGLSPHLLFYTQGNHEQLAGISEGAVSLPPSEAAKLPLNISGLDDLRHQRCALVGNSGQLRRSQAGAQIDQHDVVMRINQAPAGGTYRADVGTHTHLRFVNKKWGIIYGQKKSQVDGGSTKHRTGHTAMVEALAAGDTAVIASRATGDEFTQLLAALGELRGGRGAPVLGPSPLLLSRAVVEAAHRLLAAFRLGLDALLTRPVAARAFPGANQPSTGFIGLHLLMQMCRQVTVYGLSQRSCQWRDARSCGAYHYFDEYIDSKNLFAHPGHSFVLEGALICALHQVTKGAAVGIHHKEWCTSSEWTRVKHSAH